MIPGEMRLMTKIDRINPVREKLMEVTTIMATAKRPPRLATMGTTISRAFSRMATLAAAEATCWFSWSFFPRESFLEFAAENKQIFMLVPTSWTHISFTTALYRFGPYKHWGIKMYE